MGLISRVSSRTYRLDMPLLYKLSRANGALEFQYSDTISPELLIFNFAGVRLHPCLTKITISPVLLGGKGAFRQLMRNVGRSTTKSNNQSMSRDLNGRRLRDVENERRLQEFVEHKHEREQENDKERLERLEKMASLAKEENVRKNYIDAEFDEKSKELTEKVDQGLDISIVTSRKRKSVIDQLVSKRQKVKSQLFSLDDEELDTSSDEENSTDHVSTGNEKDFQPIKAQEPINESEFFRVQPKQRVVTKIEEKQQDYDPIDLESIDCVDILEFFGEEHLKRDLKRRDLNSEGTIGELAARLFSVKENGT